MSDGATPWPAQADRAGHDRPAGEAAPRPRRGALRAVRSRRRTVIGLTPLIDVVFILLVFYMLAATFTEWNAIPLALDPAPRDGKPPGSAQASRPQQPYAGALLLDVGPDGLRLSGRALSEAELPARLAAFQGAGGGQGAGRRVIVRAAEGVPLQRLVGVMDILAAAGVTDLSLARRGGAR